MLFNSADMLQRIRDDDPAGPDIRADTAGGSPYLRLKDARSQARSAERAAEAAGEPTTVPTAWMTVRDLAREVLTSRSKDLEVAAWLIEALVRLEGFPGLAAGFALVDGLIDRYWPDLHSVDEDDVEGRLAPLAGLNGVGAEGVLIQAHQQMKEELGLDHFEGRPWTGLHRHALMTMMAYAFLQSRRLIAAGRKKKNHLFTTPALDAGDPAGHPGSPQPATTAAMPAL